MKVVATAIVLAICTGCSVYQSESRQCLENIGCANIPGGSPFSSATITEACTASETTSVPDEILMSYPLPLNIPDGNYRAFVGTFRPSFNRWQLKLVSQKNSNAQSMQCTFSFSSDAELFVQADPLLIESINYLDWLRSISTKD